MSSGCFTRRFVLKSASVLGLAALLPGVLQAPAALAAVPRPFSRRLRIPTVLASDESEIELTIPIVEADVPVLDDVVTTRMWTFGGEFPGPTIRRPTGTTTRVRFLHQIPEAGTLTIHHHGHHTPAIDDGQPDGGQVIQPGSERLYTYPHLEEGHPLRGAMRWYHDHSHGRTNRNSWMGLVGLFVIDDPLDAGLGLPSGEREILLVLTDRTFDPETNQLTDPFTNAPDPADDSVGTGETILVNGVPQPWIEVAPARYRIRILTATAFRFYNLGFEDGPELVQVGTESGLLPRSVTRSRVLLGPAERADLLIDFSDHAGRDLVLSSAPEGSGTSRFPGAVAPHQDDVMQFRVRGVSEPSAPPPVDLRPLPSWVDDLGELADRVFAFGIGIDPETLQRVWTINGRTFDHEHVAAKPELGSTETWLLVNLTHVTHSIHIHDVDWKLISRNGRVADPAESGLKETFRLDPGELVTVGSKFTDHLGRYMIHCHMLSHEDHAMMTTFEVVPPGEGDRPPVPGTLAGVTAGEAARVAPMIATVQRRPGWPVPPPESPLVLEPGASRHGMHHA